MANSKAVLPSPQSRPSIGEVLKRWAVQNTSYIIAFFIPVILMCIAYALFKFYPFGDNSVLVLDLNAQYIYYFEALRDAFWDAGKSFFYNWSRNLSGGYMGIIGYYLASPFTLIVMLMPRKLILTSMLIMILCKIGSASVTMNLYLQKSKNLNPLHATIFSVLFSLCAYMVIQTIDPMWLDGLVTLPLIALGLEHLIDDGRKLNYIIPLAVMFVANFYIGYMIGIFVVFYFVYYLFFGSDEGRGKFSNYVYICINFGISSLVAVLCSAFMILPVYNSLRMGKFDFTDPDYSFQTQFKPIDILAQLLVAQYDSVNVQGHPEIYCGILTVVLLPLFFMCKKISMRKKLGYGFLLTVMFFSMYIKPIDMWWHGGQVPNWLPFRYSFIISFILLSMGAMAFKEIESIDTGKLGAIFFGLLAIILYIGDKEYEWLDMMGSIWLSIGLAGVYLLVLYGISRDSSKKFLPILLILMISGELVYNSIETLHDIDDEVAYSKKSSYETFVESGRATVDLMEQHDAGLYRSEKTFSRCINDNLAFGLKGLTHSSSVMNAKILSFVEGLGYNSRSYYSRYEGTTEIGDSILGIKYVLDRGTGSDRPLLHEAYTKVDTYTYKDKSDRDNMDNPKEKSISIYENPNALSIGFMADEQVIRIARLGNDNPFNSQNILLSSMVGNTYFDETSVIGDHTEYYTRIDVGEPVLGAVTVSDYNGQACYTKMDSGDPTIDYRFTVTSEQEIFCFLKTENEQFVNLWYGTKTADEEDYTFKPYGQYFETHNYSIISLGKQPIGTEISLRLTVANDQNATIIKEPFFYYFDRDQFQTDIDKLKANQLQVEKYTDTYIKGTVNAPEGQVLFTSIPYEEGWTVKVDGTKVETTSCLDAVIYVPLSAGMHTVTFSYTPPGFVAGVFMLFVGIGMMVVFYQYDKKNNKVLIAKARNKKRSEIQNANQKKNASAKPAETKPAEPKKEEPPTPEESEEVEEIEIVLEPPLDTAEGGSDEA